MMHPYRFEKFSQAREAELQQRHKHTWVLGDIEAKVHRHKSFPFRFRRQRDEAIKRKAFIVLEEMLQHENGDLRLRAAEIILRFSSRSRPTALFSRNRPGL
ncbi:hypothetical protein [Paenibacillus humicola]|uniref:hypothetical protein n=1 Tax=Paenibacillus humicola TaxID=3110540 RepID=UPI00237A9A69|nr:hypothetical protein [Paenibacillus humicola]